MKRASLDDLKRIVREESSDGAQLVRNLGDNPICAVTVDDQIGCLVVEWRGYATSAQIRYIHHNILLLLKKHRITKILGDDTALPIIHVDDQKWIVQDWLPQAKAAGFKAAANKIPHSYFGRLSVENVQSEIGADIAVRAFEDLCKARRWLAGVAT